jgi:hypothetical protein
MVNYLSVLNQKVRSSLADARIGTPVFVRWTASVAASREVLRTQLAEMAAYTGGWLSASLRRLYATGAESQEHLSVVLEYQSGSSALLALTLARSHPHMALAIYGNQGALYHNEYIVPIRDGLLSPLPTGSRAEDAARNAFEQDRLLCFDAIEQSLALHQPIDFPPSEHRP